MPLPATKSHPHPYRRLVRGIRPKNYIIPAAWVVLTEIAGDWVPVHDVCKGRRAWPIYESGEEAEAVAEALRVADSEGQYRAVAVSATFAPRHA